MDRAMSRGEFPITTLMLCRSLDTGKTHLIDGFHRLSCSRDYGHTFRANLTRIIVRTELDKKALWMFIDGGGSTRNAADYRPMLREQMDGLAAYLRGALEKGSGAIANGFSEEYLTKWRRTRVSAGERIEVIEKYLPHAHDYFKAIRRPSCHAARPMRSGFVVALGVVLIEGQKDIAIPFLESIATNEGLAKGDPRWLFAESMSAAGALNRDVLRTMQRLALCWNSHYERGQRSDFRRLGEGVAVPLKGTNYTVGG
jgi:hypothetical protein